MQKGVRLPDWADFFSGLKKNVAVIGGGGKTGLINLLEAELSAEGRPVLATVTTRLGRDQLAHLPRLEAADLDQALAGVGRVAAGERLLLTGPYVSEEKLSGLPLGWFRPLRQAAGQEPYFLIEADGSAGRPVKAHREYEPQLPPLADLQVVAVLGLSALLLPFPDSVHRPEILAERVPAPQAGRALSPDFVASFVNSAWRPLPIEVIFLNQSDLLQTEQEKDLGERLASNLIESGWTVFMGSTKERS